MPTPDSQLPKTAADVIAAANEVLRLWQRYTSQTLPMEQAYALFSVGNGMVELQAVLDVHAESTTV